MKAVAISSWDDFPKSRTFTKKESEGQIEEIQFHSEYKKHRFDVFKCYISVLIHNNL